MTDAKRIQDTRHAGRALRDHLNLLAGLLFSAGLLLWITDFWAISTGLLALALALSLLYITHHRWYSALTQATRKLPLFLATVLSGLISLVAYFLILTPAALVARTTGRDPLMLRKRPADSAWHHTRPDTYDDDYYKAQF